MTSRVTHVQRGITCKTLRFTARSASWSQQASSSCDKFPGYLAVPCCAAPCRAVCGGSCTRPHQPFSSMRSVNVKIEALGCCCCCCCCWAHAQTQSLAHGGAGWAARFRPGRSSRHGGSICKTDLPPQPHSRSHADGVCSGSYQISYSVIRNFTFSRGALDRSYQRVVRRSSPVSPLHKNMLALCFTHSGTELSQSTTINIRE
jgi:hypothetical protein